MFAPFGGEGVFTPDPGGDVFTSSGDPGGGDRDRRSPGGGGDVFTPSGGDPRGGGGDVFSLFGGDPGGGGGIGQITPGDIEPHGEGDLTCDAGK